MEIEFEKGESWKVVNQKKGYCVEIKHWIMKGGTIIADKNVWNVYVYFYPANGFFEKLNPKKEGDYSEPDLPFEFHGGCTYEKWHRDNKGEVVSKEYGCDYLHYLDDRFERMNDEAEAKEVFSDAINIYKVLDSVKQND